MTPLHATLVVVMALIPLTAHAHSFLVCTDAPSNFAGNSSCQGFPRGMDNFDPGNDILFAFRPGGSNVACNPFTQPRASPISGAYSGQFPMTVARPGQQLTLQWQSNRHKNGTVEIFKGNVKKFPDTDVEVFMAGPNLDVDPNAQGFARNPVARLAFGDEACDPNGEEKFGLCAGRVRMPNQEGVFTFQWKWKFNETYSSCFDVVVANNDQNAQALMQRTGNQANLEAQLARDRQAVERDGSQTFTNRAALIQNQKAKAAVDNFNAKANQNLQMADTNDDGAKAPAPRFSRFGRGRNRFGQALKGQRGRGGQAKAPLNGQGSQARAPLNGQGRQGNNRFGEVNSPLNGQGNNRGGQGRGNRFGQAKSPSNGQGRGGQLRQLSPLSPVNRFFKRAIDTNVTAVAPSNSTKVDVTAVSPPSNRTNVTSVPPINQTNTTVPPPSNRTNNRNTGRQTGNLQSIIENMLVSVQACPCMNSQQGRGAPAQQRRNPNRNLVPLVPLTPLNRSSNAPPSNATRPNRHQGNNRPSESQRDLQGILAGILASIQRCPCAQKNNQRRRDPPVKQIQRPPTRLAPVNMTQSTNLARRQALLPDNCNAANTTMDPIAFDPTDMDPIAFDPTDMDPIALDPLAMDAPQLPPPSEIEPVEVAMDAPQPPSDPVPISMDPTAWQQQQNAYMDTDNAY